jgi:hypothetical protein
VAESVDTRPLVNAATLHVEGQPTPDYPTPAKLDSLIRDNCTKRQRWTLFQLFGLDGKSPRTIDETAERACVSADAVRLERNKALRKLSVPLDLSC